MGVGDGVAAEDHTRDDMVAQALERTPAQRSVRTTAQTTSTLTLQIDAAIANGTSSSVLVTEIALYCVMVPAAGNTGQVGTQYLMAYDGIASTPVAAGGSIAPRYILDFPV